MSIRLVHSFVKLVTKILANWLAGRLHEMVSPNQSAFIKGRLQLQASATNDEILTSTKIASYSSEAGHF
jgi:hypothetical protein